MKKEIAFVVAMVVLVCSQTTCAQIFGSSDRPSSEFIPHSAVAGVAVFPKKIASLPDLKVFPREVVTAWGQKELGFDPMLITEVTLILDKLDKVTPGEEPGWAAVLHFEKMQGLAGAMIDKLEEKTIGGKTVYSGENGIPSFMVFDESTMIVGNESWFPELIAASGQGSLVEMFNGPSVKGQLMTFADVKQMRPLFEDICKVFDNYELPPQVDDFRRIPDLVESLELGVDVNKKFESRLVLKANNSEAAQQVHDIIVEGMQYGKVSMLAQMTSELDMDDPVQVATLQYARRVAEKYEVKFTPDVNGSELSITANEEILAVPVLLGMMGSVTRSMEFERKMTPELQLRQTVLAALNYESAYQKFPPTTVNDENGEPLFSGIARLLPFIEQNAMHDQLRFDEPWDSEHNSQFTTVAIAPFGVDGNGNSTIRFPIFPGSLWDDGGEKRFRDIQDGSSNTIFAIHVPEGSESSWADPTPWTISESNPMRDVFGDRDEVLVAMTDGSSRVLKRSQMTNEKLRALLTIAGGEVIER